MSQNPGPTRRQRAERTSRLRQRDFTWDQIAQVWMADYPDSTPRRAYRWAHNLTHEEVANRWNEIDPGEPTMVKGRIYQFEIWPAGGRRPTPYNLQIMARIYQTTARALLADSEYDLYSATARAQIEEGDHQGGNSPAAGRTGCREPESPAFPTATTASNAEGEIIEPLTLAWTVGRLDQRMDRRTLLQLATTVTVGAALDPAERLLRTLVGEHRLDSVTVGQLEDRTKGFHRISEHFPAPILYPALITHLGEVNTLLASHPTGNLRRRLAVTTGESALLAAWYAWETGDVKRLASFSRLVGAAAKHADDPVIAGAWDGYRILMTGGNNSHGVRLASSALERVGNSVPATQAWLLARMAEEAASLGDRRTALTAMAKAEDVYIGADTHARPWTYFLDAARFASMSLSVYTRIRHEGRAVAALDDLVSLLGAEPEIKKLCVVEADLAIARIRLGDLTAGIEHARSSLAATHAMSARQGWDRLDQVAKELQDSRVKAAHEFRAEYTASRPRFAPSAHS